jgi:hypothetical protein
VANRNKKRGRTARMAHAYEEFAAVYDLLMADVDYDAWRNIFPRCSAAAACCPGTR